MTPRIPTVKLPSAFIVILVTAVLFGPTFWQLRDILTWSVMSDVLKYLAFIVICGSLLLLFVRPSDDSKLLAVDAEIVEAEQLLATKHSRHSVPDQETLSDPTVEQSDSSIVWDISRKTLRAYWESNIQQNRRIFLLSVLVSIAGFGLTLLGVLEALTGRAPMAPTVLTVSAGAITQVIGTTFLVIYKATAQQAIEFNRTLERINVVGMAASILEDMTVGTAEGIRMKNDTRAALAIAVVNSLDARSPSTHGASPKA